MAGNSAMRESLLFYCMSRAILQLLRPGSWFKNVFVLAPAFFAGELLDAAVPARSLLAALAFCLLSSAVYCMNDIRDAEADRRHPYKKLRPIASGQVSKGVAAVVAVLLLLLSLSLAAVIGRPALVWVLLAYLCINIMYSLWLKRKPLIDISIVAIGFVLRIFAGSIAAGCTASAWIVMVTFLLSLFLVMGKRREDAAYASGGIYTPRFIDASMVALGACTIVIYIIYTVLPSPSKTITSDYFYITAIPVTIGILRYMQICLVDNRGGRHSAILFRDSVILWCILIYIVIFVTLWLAGR